MEGNLEVKVNGKTETVTNDMKAALVAFQSAMQTAMDMDDDDPLGKASVMLLIHDENKFIRIEREIGEIKSTKTPDEYLKSGPLTPPGNADVVEGTDGVRIVHRKETR